MQINAAGLPDTHAGTAFRRRHAMIRDITDWLIANTAQRYRMWRKTRALREEMRSLAPAELEHIMRDLGMRPNDVDQLVAGHPGPNGLLPRRLQLMGFDSE